MQTTYMVMIPGQEPTTHEVDWPHAPSLPRIRSVVTPVLNGGDLERVAVLYDGQRRDMFVDEDGHAKGLPRNEAATKIYRAYWLSQHPNDEPESLPYVVGPAVLFTSRQVWQ